MSRRDYRFVAFIYNIYLALLRATPPWVALNRANMFLIYFSTKR